MTITSVIAAMLFFSFFIERAIEKKFFSEVNELNTQVMKKDDDINLTHRFIFAVNKPKLSLWTIDEFGNFI